MMLNRRATGADASGRLQIGRRIEPKLVRNVMTRDPRPSDSRPLFRTSSVSSAHELNAFPVVDETDLLCGIVTKLDLLRAFRHDPQRTRPDLRALWGEHVKDIMRRRVVTSRPAIGLRQRSIACSRRGCAACRRTSREA